MPTITLQDAFFCDEADEWRDWKIHPSIIERFESFIIRDAGPVQNALMHKEIRNKLKRLHCTKSEQDTIIHLIRCRYGLT